VGPALRGERPASDFAFGVTMNALLIGEQTTVTLIRTQGVSVTILDSARQRHTVKAQIGQTNSLQQGLGNTALPANQVRTTDFLVPTADLGCPISRGTLIEFAGNQFRPVAQGADGETRLSRFGLITRIHTVQVK